MFAERTRDLADGGDEDQVEEELEPRDPSFGSWGVAFAVDLGTPLLAVPHSVKVPPDAAHLPERFGLFTLIPWT